MVCDMTHTVIVCTETAARDENCAAYCITLYRLFLSLHFCFVQRNRTTPYPSELNEKLTVSIEFKVNRP